MHTNIHSPGPVFGGGYVPYFYESGRFLAYGLPGSFDSQNRRSSVYGRYDFTSDLSRPDHPPLRPTVEQVIARGYLSIPQAEPETALISDKKATAWLGLDDIIGQVRSRQEIYQRNIYDLELAKCAAINSLHEHEAYHGPADSRVEYAVNKRLDELYSDQRDERINLWRDVSKLKLLLPEQAQNYLASYRKVAILEDDSTAGGGS